MQIMKNDPNAGSNTLIERAFGLETERSGPDVYNNDRHFRQ